MEIIKKLSAVMEAVGNVSKNERNQAQGFNFRGIDSVVNAVSPALRKEGVVVVPRLLDSVYETVTVGRNNTAMGHARVTVEYAFYAPDGSNITATVAAESMDSGDKATAKAMSVAFRTALLQALCLPTDERDPDADSYERSTPVTHKTIGNRVTDAKGETKKAAAPNQSTGAMTKAQIVWAEKQIAKLGEQGTPMEFVSFTLGTEVKDWSEVTDEMLKILIPVLATKGGA